MVFLPDKDKATGCAVIIAPGDGHRELVFNAEGKEAAEYLASRGVCDEVPIGTRGRLALQA